MSRIVVSTIGSLGDFHPKIEIAPELRKRGHTAIFATHKGYQPKIEALGFEFHEMSPGQKLTSEKIGAERCE